MSTTDLSAALAWLSDQGAAMEQALAQLVGIDSNSHDTVSYTHLTLPTILLV